MKPEASPFESPAALPTDPSPPPSEYSTSALTTPGGSLGSAPSRRRRATAGEGPDDGTRAMQTLIVVNDVEDWPIRLPNVEVVEARAYLTDPRWTQARRLRLFNLCRSYAYQSEGYYVSLLAAARRHRPFPSLMTVLDMKSRSQVHELDDDLDELMQRSLTPIKGERFELSIYLGKNIAKRHDQLALRLFNAFPAPFLRARFMFKGRWKLTSVEPIPAREIPDSHHAFVLARIEEYFSRDRFHSSKQKAPRYQVAILWNEKDQLRPSNPKAIERFEKAFERHDFSVEIVDKDDYGRLLEFDALFIRENTAVNHHTFRFAQRAAQAGLAVIDDPQSILRCTNKVFLANAMEQRKIPTPPTLVVGEGQIEEVLQIIGLPCVIKYPDSAFSQGVLRCDTEEDLRKNAAAILEESELYIAQKYVPSQFDWRIGVLDRKPIFAARYHMAEGHWQVVRREANGEIDYGKVEPLSVEVVPRNVLKTALAAADAIGDGLNGVDLKQFGKQIYVMEVNDNPNIDAGFEDTVLGKALYDRVVESFLVRLEALKRSSP